MSKEKANGQETVQYYIEFLINKYNVNCRGYSKNKLIKHINSYIERRKEIIKSDSQDVVKIKNKNKLLAASKILDMLEQNAVTDENWLSYIEDVAINSERYDIDKIYNNGSVWKEFKYSQARNIIRIYLNIDILIEATNSKIKSCKEKTYYYDVDKDEIYGKYGKSNEHEKEIREYFKKI